MLGAKSSIQAIAALRHRARSCCGFMGAPREGRSLGRARAGRGAARPSVQVGGAVRAGCEMVVPPGGVETIPARSTAEGGGPADRSEASLSGAADQKGAPRLTATAVT